MITKAEFYATPTADRPGYLTLADDPAEASVETPYYGVIEMCGSHGMLGEVFVPPHLAEVWSDELPVYLEGVHSERRRTFKATLLEAYPHWALATLVARLPDGALTEQHRLYHVMFTQCRIDFQHLLGAACALPPSSDRRAVEQAIRENKRRYIESRLWWPLCQRACRRNAPTLSSEGNPFYFTEAAYRVSSMRAPEVWRQFKADMMTIGMYHEHGANRAGRPLYIPSTGEAVHRYSNERCSQIIEVVYPAEIDVPRYGIVCGVRAEIVFLRRGAEVIVGVFRLLEDDSFCTILSERPLPEYDAPLVATEGVCIYVETVQQLAPS